MKVDVLLERMFKQKMNIERIEEMEKGASSRRYHRVHLAPPADPATLVLMGLPKDAMKSDEISTETAQAELPFINVQRHLRQKGLPVPNIYLDAVSDGAVLLEDLGGRTLYKQLQVDGPQVLEKWYMCAVELMAQMHRSMWPVSKDCHAHAKKFDFALLRWELDHYREWGLESLYNKTLGADVRGRLDRVFDAFAREIAQLPRGFVHRDYQSRNLMITGPNPARENFVIIDFQDALVGPRVYDLVALLNDSYVDVPLEIQQRLIEKYAAEVGIPLFEVQREFDLITVQRKLKDGGRFVFIDRVKGDDSFLPFVDKSFGRVKTALSKLDGHDDIKQILSLVDPKSFQ